MKPGQLTTQNRDQQNPFRIWGLTGGVAAGKSLVAGFFKECGIPVVNADDVGRELSQKEGPVTEAIRQRFGTTDRHELRKIIFSDPGARKDLEAILHPLIHAECLKRMKAIAQEQSPTPPVMIYEAALLIETQYYKSMDGLIVVEAPESVRKQRLIERDKLSPELADQMIKSQASDLERRAAATVVVKNTGSRERLRHEVTKIAARLKSSSH